MLLYVDLKIMPPQLKLDNSGATVSKIEGGLLG
jgi:hypothetical protein